MLENFGDKVNTNGFDKNPENATKGGRKPSIKNQIVELLESDGQIKFESNQVVSVEEDGSVIVKVPTQMQLAMKLTSWAMSKKGVDSIKAIQLIMDQIDGKGVQPIDFNPNTNKGMPKIKMIIKERTMGDS